MYLIFRAAKKPQNQPLNNQKKPQPHPNNYQVGFALTVGQFRVVQSGNLKWGIAKSKSCGYEGAR